MTTSYVERAKALIKSQARLGVLVIVPLAAALPSHAGQLTLPSGGYACVFNDASNSGASCNSYAGAGVAASGGGLSFSFASGSFALQDTPSGSESLTMYTQGQASAGIPSGAQFNFSYDIFLQDETFDPTWSLTVGIYDVTTSTYLGVSPAGSGSYDSTYQEFSGSGSFMTTSASSASDSLEPYFTLAFTGAGGTYTFVTIPYGTSVDITPSATTTPEPASVGLLGAGLAGLAALFRRRRK